MGNGLDILQFHHPVSKQPERPPGMAGRRLPATQGHQVRFEIPVRLAGIWSRGWGFGQRNFQALFDKASLHPIDFLHANRQHAGNVLVGQLLVLAGAFVTAQ
jgi:hypothetical protein